MKRDAGPAALVCHPREEGWSFVRVDIPVPPRAMWLASWARPPSDKGGRLAGLGAWDSQANHILGGGRRGDTSPSPERLSHLPMGGKNLGDENLKRARMDILQDSGRSVYTRRNLITVPKNHNWQGGKRRALFQINHTASRDTARATTRFREVSKSRRQKGMAEYRQTVVVRRIQRPDPSSPA